MSSQYWERQHWILLYNGESDIYVRYSWVSRSRAVVLKRQSTVTFMLTWNGWWKINSNKCKTVTCTKRNNNRIDKRNEIVGYECEKILPVVVYRSSSSIVLESNSYALKSTINVSISPNFNLHPSGMYFRFTKKYIYMKHLKEGFEL